MVRAAPDKEQRRTAWFSLAAAACAAVLVFFLWVSLKTEPQPTAPRRTVSDVMLDWVCEGCGRRFQARGRVEPRPCEVCGQTCYIALQYVCPTHGEFEVLVQFERPVGPDGTVDQSAREILRRWRHEGSGWLDYDGNVCCPVDGCEEKTTRPRRIWGKDRGRNDDR